MYSFLAFVFLQNILQKKNIYKAWTILDHPIWCIENKDVVTAKLWLNNEEYLKTSPDM